MPDSSTAKKRDGKSSKLDVSFKKQQQNEQQPSRATYSSIPLSYYWLKDAVREFVAHDNFPDAIAIMFTIFSVSIAFPLFPLAVLIPLLIIVFALTIYSPLIGLIALLFLTLPMIMYQAPLLAWVLMIFVAIALFLGYKNYRSITFVYALTMLPFSYLGYVLELPAFILGVLYIGFKRAVISTLVIILLVAMISGVTGIQNNSPIVYNAAGAHNSVLLMSGAAYLTPSKSLPTISEFPSAFVSAIVGFFNFKVSGELFQGFAAAIYAVTYNLEITGIQIIAWVLIVFTMTSYVIKTRSNFKGTESSLYSIFIVGLYFLLSYFTGQAPSLTVLYSFVLTVILVFVLEASNIEVVKALQVMKQDFLGKFGEAFEELTSGTKETLDDVANYDETKKELREAVLAPIEHREITGAYKVKPAKGILLFGPPGTGKTLIMRALANEIRAKFFYVKTSSIVSPFQGEGIQTLSKIFATVKKNTPAVLFFDEIDGIASSREDQANDSSRQLLSALLAEMDGFQKTEGVVIVGTTNAPNLIDHSMLRPGRFDKIIYMELPDKRGRAKIFEYYLKKLPIADDIDYSKLAEISNRYTGADIKNVCEEVARQVADEAVKQRKVLQITMANLVKVIKATKPSVSLASIDRYNQFRLDYERRAHPELRDEKEGKVRIEDVVGLADAKKALYEAVEVPILHPNLIKKYDVPNIKGILLFGPPGTGKTMMMKAVANELEDVILIIVSGSEIAKSGLENSLIEIKEVFNRARENSPSIIFIDEIDALLPNRNDASEFSVQITSEFLQQLDGIKEASGILLVGATNRPDKIDDAILRPGRMDKFIFVPPPNRQERADLFRENLKKAPCSKSIDYEKLADATEGFTGADIVNICRQVKLNALEENLSTSEEREIILNDIMKVVQSMKPSSPSSTMVRYMNFISLYGGR